MTDCSAEGKQPEYLENAFRRDRNIIQGMTVPLAVAACLLTYFENFGHAQYRIPGHIAKGFLVSEGIQMIPKIKEIDHNKKYASCITASLAEGVGFEYLQKMGILEGQFDLVLDPASDMIGAYLSVHMENFFDRKVNIARLYGNDL